MRLTVKKQNILKRVVNVDGIKDTTETLADGFNIPISDLVNAPEGHLAGIRRWRRVGDGAPGSGPVPQSAPQPTASSAGGGRVRKPRPPDSGGSFGKICSSCGELASRDSASCRCGASLT